MSEREYFGPDGEAIPVARHLSAALPALLAAAHAAIAYDAAIAACADNPERMVSFCTARGEDLDTLYVRWISLARDAIETARGGDDLDDAIEANGGRFTL